MKKAICTILVFSIYIFSLTACAASDTGSSETAQLVEDTEEIAIEDPVEEPTVEPTEEPAPGLYDPWVMVNELLVNPVVVFDENTASMRENEGGEFSYVDIKKYNAEEDVFEFSTGNDGAYLILSGFLDEVGENRETGSAQGIFVKFQPPTNDVSSLGFGFHAPAGELTVDFGDNGKPSLTIVEEFRNDPFSGSLALESGKFYYFLMALNSNGEFTSVVWEDSNADNRAGYTTNFADHQSAEYYQNSSRSFNMSFAANDTLKIAEYAILTFDGINEQAYTMFETSE